MLCILFSICSSQLHHTRVSLKKKFLPLPKHKSCNSKVLLSLHLKFQSLLGKYLIVKGRNKKKKKRKRNIGKMQQGYYSFTVSFAISCVGISTKHCIKMQMVCLIILEAFFVGWKDVASSFIVNQFKVVFYLYTSVMIWLLKFEPLGR